MTQTPITPFMSCVRENCCLNIDTVRLFPLTRLNGLCKHFQPFQLGWWLFRSLWGVFQALLSQLHAGGHT